MVGLRLTPFMQWTSTLPYFRCFEMKPKIRMK